MTLEYRMIANSSTFRAFSSPIICLTRIIGVPREMLRDEEGRDCRKESRDGIVGTGCRDTRKDSEE
jgi:hypothetical protein